MSEQFDKINENIKALDSNQEISNGFYVNRENFTLNKDKDLKAIDEQDIIKLAEVLKDNKTIKCLRLVNYPIRDAAVIALASMLKENKTIERFSLVGTQMTDKGAIALAESLMVNTTLKELDLLFNLISDQAAASFASMLKVNTTLKELDLEGCVVADKGAASFAEALLERKQNLDLHLSNNAIGDIGAVILANSMVSINSVYIVLNVKNNAYGFYGSNELNKANLKGRGNIYYSKFTEQKEQRDEDIILAAKHLNTVAKIMDNEILKKPFSTSSE